jgi:pantothenate synthetase
VKAVLQVCCVRECDGIVKSCINQTVTEEESYLQLRLSKLSKYAKVQYIH